MPTIIGSISRPAAVGDSPFTICRYCGIIVIPPNMPRPITTPRTITMLNTPLRNSRSGISASSFIRNSTNTKASTPTAPMA